MRDIVILAVVFGSIPVILARPYVGLLVWSWLSYMNPHRLAWGIAYDMPLAKVVGGAFLLSLLFSREKLHIPRDPLIVIWIAFICWICITTFFAFYPDSAQEQLIKVLKIQIISLLSILILTDMKRINGLLWVIVLSIGFYSVKGGLFTLLTGGAYRVWGPPGSFIADNNALAVAILMQIPIMYYLYQTCTTRWIRVALIISIVLSSVAALGSQSRGALIAIMALSIYFTIKSRQKLIIAIVTLIMGMILYNFMPQSWHERMSTIQNYEEDASAMGRLNAWEYTINLANDRLTGGGFESWSSQTFAIYAPRPDVHAAHSIYFGVLGDHGWIGFLLYMTILCMLWRNLTVLERMRSEEPQQATRISELARAMKIGFIAYLSGGAFLSLSYFDLPWQYVALSVALKQMSARELYNIHSNLGKEAS